MKRDASLEIPLAATHICTAEPSACLDANTLGAGLQCGRHSTFHGPSEGHPALELVGDTPGEQHGVELWVGDFDHVELDLAAAECLETIAQPVGLRTTAADHHTRTAGVDVDLHLLVTEALDVDPGHRSARQFITQVFADFVILVHLQGVVLLAVPTGLPVGDDPEP